MWPEQQQTEELLIQAKQGDKSAVNQLMERHRGALSHLVRMRLDQKILQRVDASDVVQDVLIEANRRLQTCLLYTSPSPRDQRGSRMPSSA